MSISEQKEKYWYKKKKKEFNGKWEKKQILFFMEQNLILAHQH